MGLIDLYQKAKKKITDVAAPIERKAASSLSNLYQGIKNKATTSTKSFFDPTETVRVRDVVRELPKATWDTGKSMFQGTYDVATKAPKILGEGLAYAVDPVVREQYKAGQTDILPTVTRTTPKAMLADTARSALEIYTMGRGPKLATGPKALPRVAYGAGTGYGFDVLGKISEKNGEVDKDTLKPGLGTLGGGILSGMAKPAAEIVKEGVEQVSRGAKNIRTVASQVPKAVKNSIENRRNVPVEILPEHWVPSRGVSIRADILGKPDVIPIPPQGERYVGKVKKVGFDPVTQSPRFFAPTEKLIPEQRVSRPKLPTITDVLDQVKGMAPRPGMSIKAVTPTNKNTQAINAVNTKKNAEAIEAINKMKASKPMPSIQEFAKNGGKAPEDPVAAFTRSLDEMSPNGGKPYNKYQKKAFAEKGKRIESIRKISTVPRELVVVYGKKGAEKIPIAKAQETVDLLRLGYPKEVIPKLPSKKVPNIIEKRVSYDRFPQHLLNKKPNIPQYTSEDIKNAGTQAIYMADEAKPQFEKTFGKWVANRDLATTSALESGLKYKNIPEKDGWDVINAMEYPDEKVSDTAGFLANELRQEFDNLHAEAQQSGMDIPYHFDYITHLWANSDDEIAAAYKAAGQKFKFGGGRTIPTYREGINVGLVPKYEHPAPILAEYRASLEKTKANIAFVKELKDKGMIVDSVVASKMPGFVPLQGTGFPKSISMGPDGQKYVGTFYAPSEVAEIINRVFGEQPGGALSKVLDKTGRASSTLQDLTLSGGIPKTPINAFTFAQMTKEILSGRLQSPLGSFFRSMSGTASDDFFEKNISQIRKMQARNLPFRSSLSLDALGETSAFQKAFLGSDPRKWEKIKSVWSKAMNEPTFGRFMPQLQINLFNDIEQKALKMGMDGEEAADMAGRAVGNFYGLISTKNQALRDKTTSNFISTVSFAPRYREAMIRFWAKNVGALRHPLRLENRQNIKFNIGALALFAAYDYMNKQMTGNHLWDNPDGKEDVLLIPGEETTKGLPFLSSIATVPRGIFREGKMLMKGDIAGATGDFFKTFGSTLIKPLADVATNADYFGNDITTETDLPSERFKKIGGYLAGQYSGHPYIKAAQSAMSGDKTAGQIATQALELPIRYYKNDSLLKTRFWAPFKESEPFYDRYRSLLKEDPEAAEAFYEENQELIDKHTELQPFYTQYLQMKKGGDKEGFTEILKENQDILNPKGNPLPGVSSASAAEGPPEEEKPPISKGFIRFPNGQVYSKKLGTTYDNQRKAILAEEKDDFENSDESSRDLGEVVLRRKEDGNAFYQPKSAYLADISLARMTAAESNEDIGEWMKHADTLYQQYEAMLNGSTVDELDRATIENNMSKLRAKVAKLESYGGAFTKPKTGKTKSQQNERDTTASLAEKVRNDLDRMRSGRGMKISPARKTMSRSLGRGNKVARRQRALIRIV